MKAKALPPLGRPFFLGGFISSLLLLSKAKIGKFLFCYIDLHRKLSSVLIVVFTKVIGHYLVEALPKFPKKEGAAFGLFARKTEANTGRAHVEAAVMAVCVPQALVQELVEGKLSSRKR